MRFRIHHVLFAGFLGIIALLVVLTGALVGTRVREEMRDVFEAELGRQLNLAGGIVEGTPVELLDSTVAALSLELGHRVTVIALTGEVLADSDVARNRLPEVENHATRPEVIGALAGSRSFATRNSVTVNEPFLYGAELARIAGGEVILRIAAPLTRIDAAVSRLKGRVVLTGVLAMFVALGLAWVLSVALAKPLVTMADRARLLAAGDLSIRVPAERRVAEMEDLARAFNRLGHDLEERVRELAGERDQVQAVIDSLEEGVISLDPEGRLLRWNHAAVELLSLPHDLSPSTSIATFVRQLELRHFLLEAAGGTEGRAEVAVGDRELVLSSHTLTGGGSVIGVLDVTEIRRLERVRRDFVAAASHELKTPLTSIRGFVETLMEEDVAPDLRRTFLDSVFNNAVRLQKMVDELLDLSRLESGGWIADSKPVDVAGIAREAFDPVAEQARTSEKSFLIEGDGVAIADPAGLIQVFRNLYENALRHTDAGGGIRVAIRNEIDVVHVAVEDDGEGIPSSALPRIFERFYRADSSRARDQGGTGLGLAIVRHLTDSMGGAVWAESELGLGTTVHLTLPRADRGQGSAHTSDQDS